MKTKLVLALTALVMALCAAPALAQTTAVKGKVIGPDGNPVPGAVITFQNLDNGRKFDLKTNNKGEYFSIGITGGTYSVKVTKDGQVLDQVNKYPVSLSAPNNENILDFNLKSRQAQAEAQLSPEEKARREAATKENQKIGSLNKILADARTASDAGNPAEAVKLMQEATQNTPPEPRYSILWAKLGEYDLAAAKKAPDITSRKPYYEDAISAYTKAIQLDPTKGAYHNNLGEAYAKAGKTQEAIQAYTLAAQNDPTDAAKYYFNLGAVLTNSGKPKEANEAFDKAIAANPQYAEAYYQKAVNMMGDPTKVTVDKEGRMTAPPEVAQNLNKYLELAPTGPNSDAAKQLLASLGAKVETSYGSKGKKK